MQVASHDSREEIEARAFAQNASPKSGFNFERVTAEARVHVDRDAEALAKLTHANAVTFGRDVYIPTAN